MPARTTKSATKTVKKGDSVSWSSSQGVIKGTVERTLTKPMKIKNHEVAASPEHPEILVRSDKTGALAAHKPSAIRKRKSSN